jgi:hypothetical protein
MKPPPWNLDGRAGPGREMLIEVISPHAQAMLHMPRVPGAVAHRRRVLRRAAIGLMGPR